MSFLKSKVHKWSYFAAHDEALAKEAKAARHERLHNPERAALLASLGVRLPAGATVPRNAYHNLVNFNHGADIAYAGFGAEGVKHFFATHHLRSRGKGRGKFVPHGRVRASKYMPHQGENECARRVSQR